MSENETVDLSEFIRHDRRTWQDDNLLSPGASLDFQKLCDDAFHSMRAKYFRPADLVAEIKLRKRLWIRILRKTPLGEKSGA